MKASTVTPEHVISLAQQLHAELGHRLSDDAYETALAFELERQGSSIERQRAIELRNGDETMDLGFVADLLVDQALVVRLCSLHRVDLGTEAWVLQRLALPGARSAVFLDFMRPELDVLSLASVER